MVYFDAAYIAKCYLNEPNADTVRQFAYEADGLASCEIARVEFYQSYTGTCVKATSIHKKRRKF